MANYPHSNFQKVSYSIKGKSVFSIPLPTTPNYFKVTNISAYDLYVGLMNIPSKDFFEMKVKSGTSKMLVDMFGRNFIHIYNDGLETANLILTTFSADFNPVVMAMGDNDDLADILINSVAFDGIVKGFSSPLPTGSNTIGKVEVKNALPEGLNTIGKVEVSKLSELPSGGNTIGSVGVIAMPPIPEGTNLIGLIDIANSSFLCQLIESLKDRNTYRVVSDTSTTAIEKIYTNVNAINLSKLNLLVNDGTEPINIMLGNEPFLLKGGETLKEIDLGNTVESITILADVNATAYRIIYTRKE